MQEKIQEKSKQKIQKKTFKNIEKGKNPRKKLKKIKDKN